MGDTTHCFVLICLSNLRIVFCLLLQRESYGFILCLVASGLPTYQPNSPLFQHRRFYIKPNQRLPYSEGRMFKWNLLEVAFVRCCRKLDSCRVLTERSSHTGPTLHGGPMSSWPLSCTSSHGETLLTNRPDSRW